MRCGGSYVTHRRKRLTIEKMAGKKRVNNKTAPADALKRGETTTTKKMMLMTMIKCHTVLVISSQELGRTWTNGLRNGFPELSYSTVHRFFIRSLVVLWWTFLFYEKRKAEGRRKKKNYDIETKDQDETFAVSLNEVTE